MENHGGLLGSFRLNRKSTAFPSSTRTQGEVWESEKCCGNMRLVKRFFLFSIFFSCYYLILYFFFLLINFCLYIFIICLLRHGPPRLAFASCGHALSVNRTRNIIIKCKSVSVRTPILEEKKN